MRGRVACFAVYSLSSPPSRPVVFAWSVGGPRREGTASARLRFPPGARRHRTRAAAESTNSRTRALTTQRGSPAVRFYGS